MQPHSRRTHSPNLTISHRLALEEQTLDELLAKYPRQYSLYEHQMGIVQQQQMGAADPAASDAAKQKLNALRDLWVKNAKDHPDDPLPLSLAAKIPLGRDTHEASACSRPHARKPPTFPRPHTSSHWSIDPASLPTKQR